MKQRAYRILTGVRIPQLLTRAGRRQLAILMYHGFTGRPDGDDLTNYDGLHLHIDTFRQQLLYLRKNYSVISLDEALQAFGRGRHLPERAVVLTFDDGYRSNHDLAFPLLREFSIPATIFLTTDFVDQRQYLWTDRVEYAIGRADASALENWSTLPASTWNDRRARGQLLRETKRRFKRAAQHQLASLVGELETGLGLALRNSADVPELYEPLNWHQVRIMARGGLVSVGSHSKSHVVLARCSEDRIVEEVRASRALIEERIDLPCPLFCYPNGQPGDFDHRTRRAIIDAGYHCALTTVVGLNNYQDDPFSLRRIAIMNGETHEDFVMAMCGFTKWAATVGSTWRRLGRRF